MSYAFMNRYTVSPGADCPETMPGGAPNLAGNMPSQQWGQFQRITGQPLWRSPYGEPRLSEDLAPAGDNGFLRKVLIAAAVATVAFIVWKHFVKPKRRRNPCPSRKRRRGRSRRSR